jgi:AbrB family looped-hinge helix DNA binding protein
MTLRIDKAGRIIFPKPLRERFGLHTDCEIEVLEQTDGLLLRAKKQQPSMVNVDGRWVHQGQPIPGANWDRVLEDIREERIQQTTHL